jgi:hypothetical protein
MRRRYGRVETTLKANPGVGCEKLHLEGAQMIKKDERLFNGLDQWSMLIRGCMLWV